MPPPKNMRTARRDDRSNSERYVIPNLRNACRILKLLANSNEGMKSADIARSLKIPVTTTLRIMSTLHLEGYVRKHENNFELGPVLIQLGTVALAGTEIRNLAEPILKRLTEVTDETSHLALPCDGRSLIVAVEDSPHPLRASSRPGFLADLHCSSTGKTFLAFLYKDRLSDLYSKATPAKRTPNTRTTLAELRKETDATLKRGYSLDDEEFNPGVRCLAVPVFDADASVAAAIGITASTVRFTKDRIPEMAAHVKEAAAELSALLGHSGGNA